MDRTGFIGGSDVASVFNIGYGCSRRLWYEKMGVAPDYPKDNFNLKRGVILEPVAAMLFSQETGKKIRRRNQRLFDDEYPFVTALLDREIVADSRGPGILEVKCPGLRGYLDVKRKGSMEDYILQLQLYMRVRKVSWSSFCFFSAEMAEIFHFEVLRDEELIKKVLEGMAAFWELVQRKTAPDQLDKKDKRCMRCGYQNSCQGITPEEYLAFVDPGEGIEIVFDEELERYAEERWSIKEIRDEANEMYDAVNDKIRLRMEAIGSEKVQVGRSKVYFTTVTTNRLDRKLLKAKMPDVYKEFVKPSSSKRLMLYKTK